MRTQVAIIGGGPSGLLLGQLLHNAGIDTVVLERRSRDYVLARVRAGVLETGFVDLLDAAGVGARAHAEGKVHHGARFACGDHDFRIDFKELTGKDLLIYGQTEVTRDLYDARDAAGAPVFNDCAGVKPRDLDTDAPFITYLQGGKVHRLDCEFIAGCDGFHGPCRQHIPEEERTEYQKAYPFGWLGVLSETPPVADELIYCGSERGFALCSVRNETLSRYYIQCPLSDSPDDWSDEMFWDELRRRIPPDAAEALVTGPAIEKSIAPLRSFVCEPMRWGRLFLCGDAAHIVPPTGAKGLNTAASDVHYLFDALRRHYQDGESGGLEEYSTRALARIWKTERFSWWMTNLLHRYPEQTAFDIRVQNADLAYLARSRAAQTALAENYVGLPY
jgi:p-hydroxybenzoate 3-monooxygenase